jgi:hypothetical protein
MAKRTGTTAIIVLMILKSLNWSTHDSSPPIGVCRYVIDRRRRGQEYRHIDDDYRFEKHNKNQDRREYRHEKRDYNQKFQHDNQGRGNKNRNDR